MSTKTDWDLIKEVMKHTSRILQYGMPGTGKTFIAVTQEHVVEESTEVEVEEAAPEAPATTAETAPTPKKKKKKVTVAASNSRPIYAITITPEMPAAELRGHYVPADGKFIWRDGPAISAWRNGGRLVINEIDHATGDVLSFLHNLLDDPESARMTLPTGETVRPKEGFQVIATMNGVPADLPEAMRSRFPVTIEITNPNPDAIAALPEDLRNLALGSTVNPDEKLRINIRSWFEYARLRVKMTEEKAAKAVFGSRADEVLKSVKLAKAAS